MRAVQLVTLN